MDIYQGEQLFSGSNNAQEAGGGTIIGNHVSVRCWSSIFSIIVVLRRKVFSSSDWSYLSAISADTTMAD